MFQQPRYNMPPSMASNPSQLPSPQTQSVPLPLDLSRLAPMHHEAAYEYDSFLSQLTFNSKEVITSLTRIAGENLQAAPAISTVIEQRCFHAPPTSKLPFLYLIDSIVKNIGANYISCFATNLFHTFTNAYTVAPPQVRMNMHRTLNTWPPYFGMELVTSIRRNITEQDAIAPPPGMSANPVSRQPSRGNALRMPVQNQRSQSYSYPNQNDRALNSVHLPPQQMMHQSMGMSTHPQRSQAYPVHHGSTGIPQSSVRPTEPAIPRIRSQSQVQKSASLPVSQGNLVPPPPPPSSEFIQVENMMQDINRKASSGIHPTNHQLFTINRLITTQLGLPLAPFHRNMLLQYQRRLRNISSSSRNSTPVVSAPPSQISPHQLSSSHIPPVAVSSGQLSSIPQTVPSSIAGLLRSIPQGVLAKASQSISNAVPPNVVPPQSNYPPYPDVASDFPPPLRTSSSEYKSSLPTTLKFSDLKTMSHASVVRSLYTDLPHLSKSDGMRFATKEELRDHLDWLFQQNRRKRARPENTSVGGRSRCWFDSLSVFLGKKDESDAAKTFGDGTINGVGTVGSNGVTNNKGSDNAVSKIAMVEAKGENEICQACHEGFESVWDDDRQAWMLKDAIRTEDGDVYHTNCIEVNDANASTDYERSGDAYSSADLESSNEHLNEDSLELESNCLKRKREDDTLAEGYDQITKSEDEETKLATPPEKRQRVESSTQAIKPEPNSIGGISSYVVAKTEVTDAKEEAVAQSGHENMTPIVKTESSFANS